MTFYQYRLDPEPDKPYPNKQFLFCVWLILISIVILAFIGYWSSTRLLNECDIRSGNFVPSIVDFVEDDIRC